MTSSRARTALLIAFVCLALQPVAWGTAFLHPTSIKIRVRLRRQALDLAVRGLDLKLHRLDPDGHRALAASGASESEWIFHCGAGRVSAWERGGGKLVELKGGVSVWSPSGFLRVGGKPYREEIRIFPAAHGCEVVNDVDLEKYLEGLVNSEFSSRWNEQAVEAQVVAARTYAYFRIREAREDLRKHFDVDSTVEDQVYDGSLREDFRASRSVEKTRGLVLTVGRDGQIVPIKAFYHSTCGGVTELPEHVWGHSYAGFRRPVTGSFCKTSPHYRWKLKVAGDEIREAFLKGGKSEPQVPRRWVWPRDWRELLARARLEALRPEARDAEGRVTLVSSTWDGFSGGRTARFRLEIPAVRLRGWVGVGRVLSTAFEIAPADPLGPGYWMISGRGSGHGVGMCQWGAKVMGERGYRMAAILQHYYPDAILRKMW